MLLFPLFRVGFAKVLLFPLFRAPPRSSVILCNVSDDTEGSLSSTLLLYQLLNILHHVAV